MWVLWSERLGFKPYLWYHFTPVRMIIINKSTNTESLWECGEKWTLMHCWWECRLVKPLWKTVWSFLKKLKIELLYDPAIPLLGIYLKKPKTLIQKNICSPMFISALCTIAKIWKWPKCPSTRWVDKKLWYIYSMEYYLAIWKNEILPFATPWMDLEGIVLSEIR